MVNDRHTIIKGLKLIKFAKKKKKKCKPFVLFSENLIEPYFAMSFNDTTKRQQ